MIWLNYILNTKGLDGVTKSLKDRQSKYLNIMEIA